MTITTLRSEASKRLRNLSPERLRVANDFLAYLQEREESEATRELLEPIQKPILIEQAF
jgi:hypothetical protein